MKDAQEAAAAAARAEAAAAVVGYICDRIGAIGAMEVTWGHDDEADPAQAWWARCVSASGRVVRVEKHNVPVDAIASLLGAFLTMLRETARFTEELHPTQTGWIMYRCRECPDWGYSIVKERRRTPDVERALREHEVTVHPQ